jgi:uncharacterized protein (UPF0548 family)
VLQLAKYAGTSLDTLIKSARDAQPSSPDLLTLGGGLVGPVPSGFAHDLSRSELGIGEHIFRAGRDSFQRWEQFDLGWVRIANQRPAILTGELVAVEAHTAFLWSINFSRITETVDSALSFGFLYTTTAMHVEEGQERFLLEYDAGTGCVSYLIEAVSRPRHLLARIAYPFTRAMQHRFARDSHRRIVRSVSVTAKS